MAVCSLLSLSLAGCVGQPSSVPSPTAVDSSGPSAAPTPSASAGGSSEAPGQPSPSASAPAARKQVQVFEPTASWDAASSSILATALVTQLSESGGQCVLSAESNGVTVASLPQAARADATTTTCANLRLSDSRLQAGSWSVTVSYESSGYSGVSNAVNVVIP